ncbi:MAG: hypothetical protein LBG26_04520 [Treponema sp.]|jgi:hypothetical protein|nr:hypothetical protein [Treponema sp.]
MKTKRLFVPAVLFLVSFFAACTQEPLFWYIYLEYPPIDPIIKGAPTEIVEYNGALYVANRESVWKYNYSGGPNLNQWVQTGSKPSGPILAVAAVNSAGTAVGLYVLVEGGAIYKSTDGGDNWTQGVSKHGAQKIFGAYEKLFIGDGSAVYDYESPSTSITGGVGGLLRGAAWDGTNYYICTAGDTQNTGIFTVSGTTAIKVYNASVKGIIAVGSTVIAVNSGQHVVYQDSATPNFSGSISTGVKFTGGMALWEHGGDKKILLGLQDGSGTFPYGYRELDLDGSGNVNSSGVFVPGNTAPTTGPTRTTSIDPGSRETSAIGKHPVNSLYVIPNSNSGDDASRPIIVASTQKNGVWSYRVRRGTAQWNGEDNGVY